MQCEILVQNSLMLRRCYHTTQPDLLPAHTPKHTSHNVSIWQPKSEVAGTVEIKVWITSRGAQAPVLEQESLKELIQAEALAILESQDAEHAVKKHGVRLDRTRI